MPFGQFPYLPVWSVRQPSPAPQAQLSCNLSNVGRHMNSAGCMKPALVSCCGLGRVLGMQYC